MKISIYLSLIFLFNTATSISQQVDSTIKSLNQLSPAYFNEVAKKIEKFSARVSGKTEKTLSRLIKWENKIHNLLSKVNPEAAQRLFGGNNEAFTAVLAMYKKSAFLIDEYQSQLNGYYTQLKTSASFLHSEQDKLNSNIKNSIDQLTKNVSSLGNAFQNSQNIEVLIKQRKKELLEQAFRYIGKSRALSKIDKEAYYYLETIKNYETLLSDPKKAEDLAVKILKRIPAFNELFNSQSSAAFLSNNGLGTNSNGTLINYVNQGYQSNQMVIQTLQNNLSSSPQIDEIIQNRIESFGSVLQKMKDKFPTLNNTEDIPKFTPNPMKSKTFLQRLELGTDIQFGKSTRLLPNTSDLSIQLGYHLNPKSIVGIGVAYKININKEMKISSAGFGFRGFLDWKIKNNYFISGGAEYYYNSFFKSLRDLPSFSNESIHLWCPSALIGFKKKINLGRNSAITSVLYDFLSKTSLPKRQGFIFRIGYTLK